MSTTKHQNHDRDASCVALNKFDPSACSLDGGGPCSACANILELDTKILCTGTGSSSDLFQALIQERRAMISETVNRLHDPLTRHLPTELVSRVFDYYMQGMKQPFWSGDFLKFSKFDRSASLTISAVCRIWREIAFGTPELWTVVNVYLDPSRNTAFQVELVREWLERSAEMPLQLSLVCDDGSTEDFQLLSLFFDELKTHAARWQTLRLLASHRCYGVFTAGLKKYACPQDPPALSESTPALAEFQGDCLQNLRFEWGNVTVICMKHIDFEDLEILRRARRLKKCVCSLIDNYPRNDPPLTPTDLVTSAFLEDLELRPCCADGSFLDYLVVPSLQRLVYDTWTSRGFLNSVYARFSRVRSTGPASSKLPKKANLNSFPAIERELAAILEFDPYPGPGRRTNKALWMSLQYFIFTRTSSDKIQNHSSDHQLVDLGVFDPTMQKSNAQKALQALIHERQSKVKERINPVHDQPTQHLPMEIVSRIFALCLEVAGQPFGEGYRVLKGGCSTPLIDINGL
ncbi:hypothetical protein CPB84DRAFT_1843709 [Gymnopilus junonius]|uniref:F-box domain-containing protein n=1 Tax=Gymnopilus junonius TaxID=109634 RepID=A0A9P5NV80_GYMJU|nr:hypothetical protein CPB84DRAFT_1843709 [Gymnopilus junonius]